MLDDRLSLSLRLPTARGESHSSTQRNGSDYHGPYIEGTLDTEPMNDASLTSPPPASVGQSMVTVPNTPAGGSTRESHPLAPREEEVTDVFHRRRAPTSVLYRNRSVPARETVDSTMWQASPSQVNDQNSARVEHNSQQGRQRGRTGVDLTFEDDSLSRSAKIGIFFRNVGHTFRMWRLFLSLSSVDVRRRPCAFCLGLFSVFVVVLVCVVMLSILSALPIVFLLLAEAARGVTDLQLVPGGQMASASSLNYTMVAQLFPPHGTTEDQSYHAPRIVFTDVGMNRLERCGGNVTYSDLWHRGDGVDSGVCVRASCVESRCPNSVPIDVLAYDQALEQRMKLGDDGGYPLLRDNGVIISQTASLLLGHPAVGTQVFLYMNVSSVLRQAYPTEYSNLATFTIMPLEVQAIVDTNEKKFPGLDDSFALLSYEFLNKMVARNLYPGVSAEDARHIADTSPYECATQIYFNLPPGIQRNKLYQSSSFNTIRRNVMAWASPIITAAGFTQVSVTAPIVSQLYTTRMFSVFVGLIMSIIILALAFLSIMLVYALLTVGVDTRTYELGIQRMVGFTRENLVAMVLCNAYFFTIPAWLLGLAAGQCVYLLVRFVFNKLVAVELPVGVSGASIGWASLAGLLIPLVASIFPIWNLLTLKLPEALDSNRGRTTGVIYKIKRNDSARLNGTMLGLGFLFALLGFLLYYLFPNSLVNQNLSLMFYIFFFVLIGMLAGLVLLATNFQRVVETVLLHVLLFWESRPVFRMVRKSLAAHRLRNRKTTLMYALSLSFILFITVAFETQLTSFNYSTMRTYGAEVRLYMRDAPLLTYAELRSYIATHLESQGLVTGVTYTPYAFTADWNSAGSLSTQELGSPGRYRTAATSLRPIPPNYYEVLDNRFLQVTERTDAAERYSLSGVLYTRDSLHSLLVSSSTFKYLGMKPVGEGISVLVDTLRVNRTAGTNGYRRFALSAAAAMDASPVLTASKFPSVFGDMVASIPVATRLSGDAYMSAMGLPVYIVHIRVPNKANYGRVMDSILTWNPSRVRWMRSITDATEDMDTARNVLNLFLIFTEIVILVICFFSLMSSMMSNVMDSSKEIAVLLCMGMTHFQLYRVYIWEAFLLVVASGLLGLIVGTVVAYTMQMQNVLFTQLPLPFTFPYIQLCIIVGVGLLSALAASISPVSYLLHMPSITHILRRTIH